MKLTDGDKGMIFGVLGVALACIALGLQLAKFLGCK